MAEIVTIARLGHRGDGVVEASGGPIYVRGALAGERVEIGHAGGERATLVRVLQASPDRLPAYCPHAGRCGGCAVQHLAAAASLEWKRGLVRDALRLVRIEAAVEPCIDAHGAGRRRATFHARRGPDGRPRAGFAEARSHAVLDLSAEPCPLLAPGLKGAVAALTDAAQALAPVGKPFDAVATATLGGLDMDLRGAGRLPDGLRLALTDLAARHDLARLALHGEVLIERRPPVVRFGRAHVVPPPGGFLQATEAGEEALAGLVSHGARDARRVADLFAGSGAFALRLAEQASVLAVESDEPATAALARARRQTSGLKPVQVVRRDLFRRPLSGPELGGLEAVVFDPPRAGGEAQARALAGSPVQRVVAVSCNPGTLARDLRILVDGGYRIDRIVPVDQFRHAAHVEVVALLSRP